MGISPLVGYHGRLQSPSSTFRAEFGFAQTATALYLLNGKRRTINVGKNTAVFGIYKSRTSAEKADNLISAGFPSGDVSVLLPDIQHVVFTRSKQRLREALHLGRDGFAHRAIPCYLHGNIANRIGCAIVGRR
jgi:hypothetical protein